MDKKGQTDVSGLYNFVLLLVLIGLVVGIGLVVLTNFEASTAVSGASSTALNNTISAIADIPGTWLSLIVTVAVLAIILTLVIRSFGGMGSR